MRIAVSRFQLRLYRAWYHLGESRLHTLIAGGKGGSFSKIWHFPIHCESFTRVISGISSECNAWQSNDSKSFSWQRTFQTRGAFLLYAMQAAPGFRNRGIMWPRNCENERASMPRDVCIKKCILIRWNANEYKSHVEFNALLKYYQFKLYSTCIFTGARIYIIQSNFAEIVAYECSVCIN